MEIHHAALRLGIPRNVPLRRRKAGMAGELLHVAETATALDDLAGGLGDERSPSRGKDFTAERIAVATTELRDMVIDAWRTSTDVGVGYPHVKVRDVEAGKVIRLRS
jgi:hypothetical protein